jgi:cyclase
MLTKRIIACLDVHAGRVVKGVQFVDLIDAGDPATQAARHAREGADEIVLLDITATHERRQTLLETVRRTARELFVPFAVGGGIRSAQDAGQVFDAGADKVSINSAALADPGLIDAIGRSFGAQAVVVAIDARRDPQAAVRRSLCRAGASRPAAVSSSGRARPKIAAQARFCSRRWIPTEPVPASIAN